MAGTYASYPLAGGSGGGVPTYATLAAFPSAVTAGNGALAIALDTDILYISNGTVWEVLANPSYAAAITSLTGDVTATGPGAAAASLVATANATLVTLSALTTASALATVGTITSGTWSASTIAINRGGTGQVTAAAAYNALSPMTTTGDLTYEVSAGTAGRRAIGSTGNVLTVSGGLPVWAPPATSGTVTSVAMTVPTFLSVAGSPITSSGTLAVTLSGTALPILNGGTGQTTAAAAFNALSPMTTTGDLTYEVSANTAARLAIGSTGNVLTVVGGVPAWAPPATSGTVTSVAMTVPAFLSVAGSPVTSTGTLAVTLSGTALPVANGGTGQVTAAAAFNALSPITTTGDMIYSPSGATSQRLAVGSTGNVLTVSGGVPTWAPPATSGTVTSVAMTVPTFLSIGGSPITSSGTLAVTLSGTALPIANGGTGVTSVTTSPTASAFSAWDASKNLSANNFLEGYTTTATAAGTTTLTVTSTQIQYFTGSTTQTVILPVTSTLALGFSFQMVNLSTGIVTVQSSGANNIIAIPSLTACNFTCILTSGTTAASWNASLAQMASTVFSGSGVVFYGTSTGTNANIEIDLETTASNARKWGLVLRGDTSGAPLQFKDVTNSNLISLQLLTTGPVWVGPAVADLASFTGNLIRGVSSGAAPTAGMVGEYISATGSAVTCGSTGAGANLTSISLTAGDWDVTGMMEISTTATTVTVANQVTSYGISATSATITGTLGVDFLYGLQAAIASVNGAIASVTTISKRVTISTTTTIYFVASLNYTGSAPTMSGGIFARRRW